MVEGLERLAIFEGLTRDQLRAVGEQCEIMSVKRGETVFRAGESAQYLLFVRSGRVELRFQVVYAGATDEYPLDTVTANGACGWSAMIPPHKYTLTAHAVEDSELLRIKQSDLQGCCDTDPRMGYVVMGNIARTIGARYELARRILVGEIQNNLKQRDPLA
ncbi:MAG: cyclic nucleotide-binding domain-containing protein [Gemmatimonadota bacterium]|nr:cyclic nucleotide-binding domain-containing protein [Gemmatimonadota bacterium]MDH3368648.1 cyclic nucleotide-binding domain-containing protein [Gemmatimonadota bacterium]MDH3478136.1 cyclic nucleotide-binding domain-containing protein [Gemmatimonadota bacterium]MDH3571429.1 cyclic nucleotide-binding domain-containing protein [Gemmatimonadota bacterium]MDH5550119.1 cyclic nucleotide-binding domain-containing protein [Gemmatimonadota bacterium]